MKTARIVTLILTIAAAAICCLGLNLMGGFAFIANGYEKCGYALFFSSALLSAAVILGCFKKVILPVILDIFGSAGYIYTLSVLNAIPNTKIPKASTEALMANHYPTIIVTVLIILLAVFNFMQEDAVEKRRKAKAAKTAAENRSLNDNERIL